MRLLGKGCTNSGLKRRDNERVEFIAIREMLTNYFLQRTAGPYRWVIFDRSGQSCLPVHVRFGLKADLRLVRQATSEQQKLGELSNLTLRLPYAVLTGAPVAKEHEKPENRKKAMSNPDLFDPLAKQRHREAFTVSGRDRLFLMA